MPLMYIKNMIHDKNKRKTQVIGKKYYNYMYKQTLR